MKFMDKDTPPLYSELTVDFALKTDNLIL